MSNVKCCFDLILYVIIFNTFRGTLVAITLQSIIASTFVIEIMLIRISFPDVSALFTNFPPYNKIMAYSMSSNDLSINLLYLCTCTIVYLVCKFHSEQDQKQKRCHFRNSLYILSRLGKLRQFLLRIVSWLAYYQFYQTVLYLLFAAEQYFFPRSLYYCRCLYHCLYNAK